MLTNILTCALHVFSFIVKNYVPVLARPRAINDIKQPTWTNDRYDIRVKYPCYLFSIRYHIDQLHVDQCVGVRPLLGLGCLLHPTFYVVAVDSGRDCKVLLCCATRWSAGLHRRNPVWVCCLGHPHPPIPVPAPASRHNLDHDYATWHHFRKGNHFLSE